MVSDVFISYSSNDKHVADAACATIEQFGIRCWIAPRDIRPGDEYGAAIVNAIDSCHAMVLIFSSNANSSQQIRREVERAVSRSVPILPMRIENVLPTASLAYFVDSVHWLDAITPPLEDHLHRLAESISGLLQAQAEGSDVWHSDEAPRRLSRPAESSRQVASPIWSPIGKLLAISLVACAGLAGASLLPSFRFGRNTEPPPAAVAERVKPAPAKPQTDQAIEKTAQASKISEPALTIKEASAKEAPVKEAAVTEAIVKEASAAAVISSEPNAAQPDSQKDGGNVPAAAAAHLPDDTPRSSGDVPAAAQPSDNTNPLFTPEDANRVAQVATQKKLILPEYRIADIDPRVPANVRRFIGIWVSKIGFNGGFGKEAMIIISDADNQGRFSGLYIQGPPTQHSLDQKPPWSRPISGKINDNGLSFEIGGATVTVSFSTSNALFIKWTRKSPGPTPTNTLYPIWMLSAHETASATPARKPK